MMSRYQDPIVCSVSLCQSNPEIRSLIGPRDKISDRTHSSYLWSVLEILYLSGPRDLISDRTQRSYLRSDPGILSLIRPKEKISDRTQRYDIWSDQEISSLIGPWSTWYFTEHHLICTFPRYKQIKNNSNVHKHTHTQIRRAWIEH